MKKILLSLLTVGLVLCASSAFAGTASITLHNIGTGNLLTNIGPFKIIGISVQASTATNTSVVIYDSPTNGQTASLPAYTNTLTVATNQISTYTNFFGVTTLLTNVVLLDITNNLVAAAVTTRPIVWTGAAAASSTTVYSPLNLPVVFGLYFTNTAAADTVVNITYIQ
jgi:hypothetical protein